MKLTTHFTFEELTDSASYPHLVPKNRELAKQFEKRLRYVAGTLEEIRAVLGCRVHVNSGYRFAELNKAVGGSATSKHMFALCADIVPLDGMTVEEAFELLIANKDKLPSLRKCIIEGVKGKVWLHIQTKLEAKEPTDFLTTNDGVNFEKVA